MTADADRDIAARRIDRVKLLNSGQTCIAPDYVLAERSIRDQLVAKVVATVAAFRADQDVTGMRIVNERQFVRLAGYVEASKGTVVTGGGSDRESLTMGPTVIVDPDPDEIFGPILPVLAVDSINDAIRFVNGRPKPLALYVFAKSKASQTALVDRIPAGDAVAVINHAAPHCLVPSLPFGGVGASGMRAYHGEWGFQALSHRKSVLSKTFKPDLQIIYPPYNERAKKIMRRIF